jgi:HSP20 family protein
MVMMRWNPYEELRRMREEMDRRWGGNYPTIEGDDEIERWTIPLDVVEEENNLIVHATMPGVKPEDIDVTLEDNIVTIKGKTETEEEHKEGEYLMREHRTGAFHRMLRLPGVVDTEKARTTYENGVLTITFPKAEAKKAKRLNVAVDKALEGEKK